MRGSLEVVGSRLELFTSLGVVQAKSPPLLQLLTHLGLMSTSLGAAPEQRAPLGVVVELPTVLGVELASLPLEL